MYIRTIVSNYYTTLKKNVLYFRFNRIQSTLVNTSETPLKSYNFKLHILRKRLSPVTEVVLTTLKDKLINEGVSNTDDTLI